jgi:hypothetical protein
LYHRNSAIPPLIKAPIITPDNAIQFPSVRRKNPGVGVGDGETVAVGEAVGLLVTAGFGDGEAFPVGDVTGLGGDDEFWAKLTLARNRLTKTALKARKRL